MNKLLKLIGYKHNYAGRDRSYKFKGGYNYRGYCVYGSNGCWVMRNEHGDPLCGFLTLKAFKKHIDNSAGKI